jgi:hypothetical protein
VLGATAAATTAAATTAAAIHRLGLSDHFLVGRTGFSVNRFDYGVSERIGSRPSMEDKSTIIQVPV